MEELTARLAGGSNSQVAGAGALAGTLIGAGIYLNLSGAILGLVIGLGICGLIVTLAAIAARALGVQPVATPVPSFAHAPMTSAVIAATAPAVQQAFQPAPTAAAVTPAAPGTAGEQPAPIDATDSEAELISSGRFAEYHLAKAKRLMAARNYREAAQQAAASLAHDSLPEAAALRKAALAAR